MVITKGPSHGSFTAECVHLSGNLKWCLTWASGERKLIFGLQVNIDKAKSRRYDVNRKMVYRGPSKDLHVSVLYCIYSSKSSLSSMGYHIYAGSGSVAIDG